MTTRSCSSSRLARRRILIVSRGVTPVKHALTALRPFYDVVIAADRGSCLALLDADPSFEAMLVDGASSEGGCMAVYLAIAPRYAALARRAVFLCQERSELRALRTVGARAVMSPCALPDLLQALGGV